MTPNFDNLASLLMEAGQHSVRSVNGSKILVLPSRVKHIIDRHGTNSMHAKALQGDNPQYSGLSGSIFIEDPTVETFEDIIRTELDTSVPPESTDELSGTSKDEFYTWSIPCRRCGYFLIEKIDLVRRYMGRDYAHVGWTSAMRTDTVPVFIVDRPLQDFIADEIHLVFKKVRNYDVYRLWTAYPARTGWNESIWRKDNAMLIPIS